MVSTLLVVASLSLHSHAVPLALNVRGLSGDGNIVYGSFSNAPGYWSEKEGLRALLLPAGFRFGEITGMSSDGSVAIGRIAIGRRRITAQWYVGLWRHGKIQVLCPTLADADPAISEDGLTVVGPFAAREPNGSQSPIAFKWSSRSGFELLRAGIQSEPVYSCATSCSADGSLVLGWSTNKMESVNYGVVAVNREAAAWNDSGKLISLHGDDGPAQSTYDFSAATLCEGVGGPVVGETRRRGLVVWPTVSRPPSQLTYNGKAAHCRDIWFAGSAKFLIASVIVLLGSDGDGEKYDIRPVIWSGQSPKGIALSDLLGNGGNGMQGFKRVLGVSDDGTSLLFSTSQFAEPGSCKLVKVVHQSDSDGCWPPKVSS